MANDIDLPLPEDKDPERPSATSDLRGAVARAWAVLGWRAQTKDRRGFDEKEEGIGDD